MISASYIRCISVGPTLSVLLSGFDKESWKNEPSRDGSVLNTIRLPVRILIDRAEKKSNAMVAKKVGERQAQRTAGWHKSS